MNGELSGLMKQFEKMQENLAQVKVTGLAGTGMVKVNMNGTRQVQRVEIDPGLLGGDADREMLEDLIAAAVNDAHRRLESALKGKVSELTAGLPLPGGIKLPL